MTDDVSKKPNVHDEPIFESMRRIATLRIIPPLSGEQVRTQIETYGTRSLTRSYRKTSALAFLFIAVNYVSEWGRGVSLLLAGAAFLAVIVAAVLIWRGNRVGLAAAFAFVAIGLVRNIGGLALALKTGGPREGLIMLGVFGFFLHVFAAALQIEIARRKKPDAPMAAPIG